MGRPSKPIRVPADIESRNELVVSHLWLVGKFAQRAYHRILGRIPLDDLKQYGNIGLIDAADTYNPSRGCAFRSHAGNKIPRAIIDGIRGETHSQNHGKYVKGWAELSEKRLYPNMGHLY